MPDQPRPQRADAARNRARVLEVAYQTFAEEGLSVPIDEIARRAGVGAGTVYRHFPTKEALFEAIAADRLQHLSDQAAAFAEAEEPGEAFFGYLAVLVEEGKSDQGLVDALAGIGFDIASAIPDVEKQFMAVLEDLLTRAQRAGAVRADIGVRDVKALMVGCQAMQRYSDDPDTASRTLAVVRDGLTSR
jgi:AcrR family transcriptional regulator